MCQELVDQTSPLRDGDVFTALFVDLLVRYAADIIALQSIGLVFE
jgi:hypothetical protein